MTLATKTYMHKPLYVEAVQVTSDNMAEVAEWCDGTIKETHDKRTRKFISVDVYRPLKARQSMAFAGDWMLKTPNGFKIYTKEAFEAGFVETDADVSV